mmetsp:Transcript_71829/g.206199  ORF Transcript_71829/g.206199 Transcript_71829/m.206199 type:complete len:324 (+) Transcript_71829:553-1524(+)
MLPTCRQQFHGGVGGHGAEEAAAATASVGHAAWCPQRADDQQGTHGAEAGERWEVRGDVDPTHLTILSCTLRQRDDTAHAVHGAALGWGDLHLQRHPVCDQHLQLGCSRQRVVEPHCEVTALSNGRPPQCDFGRQGHEDLRDPPRQALHLQLDQRYPQRCLLLLFLAATIPWSDLFVGLSVAAAVQERLSACPNTDHLAHLLLATIHRQPCRPLDEFRVAQRQSRQRLLKRQRQRQQHWQADSDDEGHGDGRAPCQSEGGRRLGACSSPQPPDPAQASTSLRPCGIQRRRQHELRWQCAHAGAAAVDLRPRMRGEGGPTAPHG